MTTIFQICVKMIYETNSQIVVYYDTYSHILLLTTKFGKAEKTGQSGFVFRNIRFSQFQNRNREGDKQEDLRILVHLRHGKGVRSIKETR
jgi:hypothetical protein